MRIHVGVAFLICMLVGAGAYYLGMHHPRETGLAEGWGKAVDATVEDARKRLERLAEDYDKRSGE